MKTVELYQWRLFKRPTNILTAFKIKLIILVILTGLSTQMVFSDAEVMSHPIRGESGYWISENDMDAMLLALDKVDQLEVQLEVVLEKNDEVVAEFNILVDDYNKLKKKVGMLWGVTLGSL